MPELSVIVPVYNGERYLSQCICSILNQTFKDLELILVDDGSSDQSPEICMHYAERDKRVVFLKEKNAGTSSARNYGIRAAQGKFITFSDNDDFLDDMDAYKRIMKQLDESDADVLMFDTYVYNDVTKEKTYSNHVLKREQVVHKTPGNALKTIMNHSLMARAVWAKVFKAEMLKKNHILFPDGMRNEDTAFTAEVFLHAQSYDWYEGVFYCYRINTGVSQTSEPLNKQQLDDLKNILIDYISRSEMISDEPLRESMYSYLAFPFAVWLGYASKSRKISRKDFRDMKRYSFVLKYDQDSSMKSLSKLYKICGYNITKLALSVWVSLNR